MENILVNSFASMASSFFSGKGAVSNMKIQERILGLQMEALRKQAIKEIGEMRKGATAFIGKQAVSLISKGWGLTEGDSLIEGNTNLAKMDIQDRSDYYNDQIKNLQENFAFTASQQAKSIKTQAIIDIAKMGVGMGMQAYSDNKKANTNTTPNTSNFGDTTIDLNYNSNGFGSSAFGNTATTLSSAGSQLAPSLNLSAGSFGASPLGTSTFGSSIFGGL